MPKMGGQVLAHAVICARPCVVGALWAVLMAPGALKPEVALPEPMLKFGMVQGTEDRGEFGAPHLCTGAWANQCTTRLFDLGHALP